MAVDVESRNYIIGAIVMSRVEEVHIQTSVDGPLALFLVWFETEHLDCLTADFIQRLNKFTVTATNIQPSDGFVLVKQV